MAFSEHMNFSMKLQVQFFSFVEYHKVLLKLSLALQHVLQFLERAHLDKRLRYINLTCYVNKDFIIQVLVCTITTTKVKINVQTKDCYFSLYVLTIIFLESWDQNSAYFQIWAKDILTVTILLRLDLMWSPGPKLLSLAGSIKSKFD